MFQEAYFQDTLFNDKFSSCDTVGDAARTVEDRFSPFHLKIGNATDLFEQLGGGWSQSVAFDCDMTLTPAPVSIRVRTISAMVKPYSRSKVQWRRPVLDGLATETCALDRS